ncbi:hypothetical protein H2199_005870 [Coniosporium tulheliwenetii]|uniref:Uncharacterized protein n=1 Tax=Coniosporium tulheliwenetii TaxID=3383036 RepID=A0ACC2YZA4_9PEZI|nr:hypothetical protein H2199_005870 [Cladosporium sp. JES 115]
MSATPSPSEGGLQFSNKINENDHGAYVTLVAAASFTCSVLFYIFRLYSRLPIRRLFKIDDATTTVGTIIAIGQFVAISIAVQLALGKHIAQLETDKLEKFYKATYAADLLFIACMCSSRLAMILFVQRCGVKKHFIATYVITAITIVWGIAALILIAVPCEAVMPWNSLDSTCSSLATRWTIIVAGDIFIEIALLALPVYLVWDVQITVSTKWAVITPFWLRAPVIVLSTLRLLALHDAMTSTDYTFDLVLAAVYTQLEMHACLVSATVPCMRPFLKAFDTGYWGTTIAQVDPTASTTKGSAGSGYALQSKSSGARMQMESHTMTVDIPMGNLRPEPVDHSTRIEHIEFQKKDGQSDNGSLTSHGSDKMIIRKTVAYSVE